MPGISVKFKTGPITFAAESPVTGGMVVEAGDDPGTMRPAAAGSTTVLGVVLTDAAPYVKPDAGVFVAKPEAAAVASAPAVVPVDVDGTVTVGALVVASDDGTVAAAAAESPIAAIVGRVLEVPATGRALVRLGL